MGEKITFPKNYELYLKQAMKYFNSGKMREATEYFKSAYSLKQDRKLNTFYVTALYQIGEYTEAKKIAEDKIDFYKSEERLYTFYTSILIKCHYFIQADSIIKKKLKETNNTQSQELWKTLELDSENEKKKVRQDEEKKNSAILKNALSMSNQPFEQQLHYMKDAEQLPMSLFIKAARSLLSNPYVNEIVKTSCLERLVLEKVEESFSFGWFGEQREVIPSGILPLKKMRVVQKVSEGLTEIENDNPTLYQSVVQEASIHFILLYPYIDEVIVSPSIWIALYLKRYDPDFEESLFESSEEAQKMEDWMDRLNDQIQEWQS